MQGEIETEIMVTGKVASPKMPPLAEYAKVNEMGYLVWYWMDGSGEIREAGHVQFKHYLRADWKPYLEKP